MAEYSYIGSPSKIESFLEKIQDVAVPSKATQTWLASIGFTSTNDRALIPIMKQIGFIDTTGKPTAAWEKFRGGDRSALAAAVMEGYGSFYSTYQDAQNRSIAELENIVKSTAPRLGKDAVARVLTTFRTLAKEADFGLEDVDESKGQPGVAATSNGQTPSSGSAMQTGAVVRSLGVGVTINVNVQLTLPETTDGAVYEKLFAAMRDHLLFGLADGS